MQKSQQVEQTPEEKREQRLTDLTEKLSNDMPSATFICAAKAVRNGNAIAIIGVKKKKHRKEKGKLVEIHKNMVPKGFKELFKTHPQQATKSENGQFNSWSEDETEVNQNFQFHGKRPMLLVDDLTLEDFNELSTRLAPMVQSAGVNVKPDMRQNKRAKNCRAPISEEEYQMDMV